MNFRWTYRKSLVLTLLVFAGAIIGTFLFFQYTREKEYKERELNERLQIFNRGLLEALELGETPMEYIARDIKPMDELRVTVVDSLGRVVFDNSLDSLPGANHLTRPEIAEALREGSAYSVRRHSQTTDNTYFYSAMARQGRVVRSAVPYSGSLTQMLGADTNFLWFMVVVVVILTLLAWLMMYLVSENERQIQDKVRVKRQLTNNINHELKTPIAAIQVCVETLVDHPELPEDTKQEILQKCLLNSNRLTSLLADVSTLARLDDGHEKIEMEPLQLREIVKDVVAEFPDTMPIKGNIPANLRLNGNRELLSSVFRNLITNANAYSHGTEIQINAEERSGHIVITFADNGVGIGDEHLERIFERFYRIDKGRSREKGGTGLGLSIVRNAILQQGGTVTASNRPSGGLQFTISFRHQ